MVGLFSSIFFKNGAKAHFVYGADECIKCYEDLGCKGGDVNISEDQIKRQNSSDRIWKLIYLEKGCSLGISEGLLNPIKAKVDNLGCIYIYDKGDSSIKKFSSDGKYIQKYGKGVGQGPGEFLNITDVDIKDNGEIWVCDPILG